MMKNKKTVLIIVITILLLSTILYFVPLGQILGNLPLINRFYNNTTISVVTQNCKAKVWINGTEYGETPVSAENLPQGTYTIELERISDEGTFYNKQSIPIELAKNTEARIDLEIGPDDILQGTVLYYSKTPKLSSNEGLLTITSSATDSKIYIDGEFTKSNSVTGLQLEENQYQIKVTASGYEDVEIPVLVRAGYNLNLKTYHFPIPITFDTLE